MLCWWTEEVVCKSNGFGDLGLGYFVDDAYDHGTDRAARDPHDLASARAFVKDQDGFARGGTHNIDRDDVAARQFSSWS